MDFSIKLYYAEFFSIGIDYSLEKHPFDSIIYIYKAEKCLSVRLFVPFSRKNHGDNGKNYFKDPHWNSSWSAVGIFNLTSEVIRGHFEAIFDFKS